MSEGQSIEISEPTSTYETLVGTIEQPMINLVSQLSTKFRNGDYYLLIGDDTSGRIPTLVMKKVADYVSDTSNNPRPEVRFVQAGRKINDADVALQVANLARQQLSKQGIKKALLVTEFIRSGGVMKRLTDLLGSNGISFDVAALDLKEPEENYRQQGIFSPDTQVFSGNMNRDGKHEQPEIWQHSALTGLQPAMKQGGQVTVKRSESAREITMAARRDVQKMSDKIIHTLGDQIK